MTFSIAARCPLSGMFGAATTTRNIAVGGRCIFARAGTGAVITQHVTDPGQGHRGLASLTGAGSRATSSTIWSPKIRPSRGVNWRR